MKKAFDEVFVDHTKYGTKIQTNEYHEKGSYIIIDQGQHDIAGYTDREDGLFTNVPAIVFGDHTRVVKYVDKPFFLGADGVKVLKSKIDDANYKYLYYALKHADIPNTGYNRHFKWLKELKIEYPDKKTQNNIVAVLDRISLLIDLQQIEINNLNELVKARFVEMFGNERNSKGWDEVNVSDVADVSVGIVIKPAQYYTSEEEGIKTFRSLNVGKMNIKDNDWVYISKDGNEKNKKSQLKENDLLVVRSGAPGTSCVITKEYAGCNAIDVIIVHPDINKVDPYYLCAYTNYPHGKDQIEGGTGGAAQQHFNVGKYNSLRLFLPPLEEQKKFTNFLKEIDKSKAICQKKISVYQELLDKKMDEYFNPKRG